FRAAPQARGPAAQHWKQPVGGVNHPDAAPGARADKVATCTRCQEQKYLKGNECVDGASNCDQGQFGKPDADKGNRCVSCTDQTDGVTDCETCEYNAALAR
ncbi:Molecular chaperone, DnaJ family protein, partial [Giardia duodenalis]